MALTAYLRLKAQQQGDIRGSVTQKGREGRIAVLESNHEVVVPADVATGMASGKPQHRPFIVVKEIDQATPALYQALLNHEVFTEFELQYWAPHKTSTAGGAQVMRYAVRLGNARLQGIRFVQPDVLDPALKAFPEAEELSFVYQRIEWLWQDPPRAASDDLAPARPRTSRRRKAAEADGAA